MKKILNILFFILIGCTAGFTSINNTNIDPAFNKYIVNYQKLKHGYINKQISMLFSTLPGHTIGLCTIYDNGERYIQIDPEFWFNTTDNDKQTLIFHELGHCDLNRNHTGPASIMEVYHINGSEYERHRDYYNDELFGRVKKQTF